MTEAVNPPGRRSRDPEATKARLLAAAREEFAEHGFAGARVDRVAEDAGTSKRMIYAYFDSKQGLFDAVVESNIERQLDEVPFTADDLPGYAVRYFDQLVAEPESLRLAMWRSFESVVASPGERASFARKVKAIERAQADGAVVDDVPAADVLAMLLALTRSWLTATPALREIPRAKPDGAARMAQHREALRQTVRRALTPGATG